jgi:hypothetical protein
MSTPRSKGRRKQYVPNHERNIIINSKKPPEPEPIYFNSGLMPENSWRCLDCTEGFTLTHRHIIKLCPKCGSDDLIEYHKAKLAEQVPAIKEERDKKVEKKETVE